MLSSPGGREENSSKYLLPRTEIHQGEKSTFLVEMQCSQEASAYETFIERNYISSPGPPSASGLIYKRSSLLMSQEKRDKCQPSKESLGKFLLSQEGFTWK